MYSERKGRSIILTFKRGFLHETFHPATADFEIHLDEAKCTTVGSGNKSFLSFTQPFQTPFTRKYSGAPVISKTFNKLDKEGVKVFEIMSRTSINGGLGVKNIQNQ